MQYEIKDAKLVRITSTGRVLPLADGATEITALYGDKSIKISVKTEDDSTKHHCNVMMKPGTGRTC